MTKSVDVTGQRFSHLVAVEKLKTPDKHGKTQFLCVCDCGRQVLVTGTELRCGNKISCGCVHGNKKYFNGYDYHNPCHARLYSVWNDMKRRCEDIRRTDYVNYGARGISVCNEWQDFQNFFDWAVEKELTPSLSIDRIDNDGNYSPENCRIANPTIQANNRRGNHLITYNGKTQTMANWAREVDIPYTTIRNRQRLGWSDEDTLTIPVRKGGDGK